MAPSSGSIADRILVVVAMEAEAAALRSGLGLSGSARSLHPAFPCGLVEGDRVAVATSGVDRRFAVDAIATQPAVLATLLAAEEFRPSLIVSAGTAGGFADRGGSIGDVYVSTEPVVYHDRRIGIPGWDVYGVGSYPVVDVGHAVGRAGAKPGVVSTGNSLDAPPGDRAAMDASGATAKDMEAAAVAWVAEHLGIPFLAVKAITDLVDHPEDTAEQFGRNLALATARLAEVVPRLFDQLAR